MEETKDTLRKNKENELGCIYLITNLVNNKQYVGQSSNKDCNVRFERHWLASKYKSKNIILYNAMRSYGKDCFKVESLCIVPRKALNNMEMYWAEQLETYIWDNPGGYNMVWCGNQGNLGLKQSPELIKKRFAPLIGRKQEKASKTKT
jgi:group I intron endonuclease